MTVALWVLGDTEDEVEAELIRRGLRPAGRMLPVAGRARFMQRIDNEDEADEDC
ncbi:hypothetical protein PV703_11435 [Streptomyces sp. ME01-24h]|nr:hypothetical protein [Streptomyces sp. ME01-24h]